MNDTPAWVLKEAAKRCAWHPSKTLAQLRGYLASSASFTELCRAIEQREAFRQEVSDALLRYHAPSHVPHGLQEFIIPAPKPDPLVAALEGVTFDHYPPNDAKTIRAALDALGFEIREKNDG